VALAVETFGTGSVEEPAIEEWVLRTFDLTPRGIIERLDLLRPIYTPTSAYGHFGRRPQVDGAFPWEGLAVEAAVAGQG